MTTELKSYLDRIMRLHEERKGLSDDISEIYAEAKGRGFDRKALVATVKRLMGDETAFAELDATVDLYLRAYRGVGTEVDARETPSIPHAPAPARMREGRPVVIGDTMCLSDIRRAWKDGFAVDSDKRFRNASVYFFHDLAGARIKVGVSNDVDGRRETLSREQKTTLTEIGRIAGNRQLELGFLKLFEPFRIGGEWFRAEDQVFSIINMWLASEQPHNPETGEIIEPTRTDGSTESCGDVDGHMPSEGGVTSQSASPLTQQGTATPDSLDEVGRPQSATLQSGSSGSECTRTTHSPATVGNQPGPQDTPSEKLPTQVHKAMGGTPLSPPPDKAVLAEIPPFLRADPDAKHWENKGGNA